MVEFIVHKLVHEGVRMVNNLRSPEIIKLANQRSILRVEELAKYFNVSVQTIRKDLNKLCSDGQLERVHGGAIIPSQIENIEYEHRKNINFSGSKWPFLAVLEAYFRDSSVVDRIARSMRVRGFNRAILGLSN